MLGISISVRLKHDANVNLLITFKLCGNTISLRLTQPENAHSLITFKLCGNTISLRLTQTAKTHGQISSILSDNEICSRFLQKPNALEYISPSSFFTDGGTITHLNLSHSKKASEEISTTE